MLLLRFFFSLLVHFVINSQAGQREGVPDTVGKHRHRKHPNRKREIVSSRCATVTVQSFFGVRTNQKTKKPKGVRLLRSTADRTRLLFAHKVRNEVKLVLS